MDRDENDDFSDPFDDDPVLGAVFVAELERVVGSDDSKFQWLLPTTGFEEVLEVLRATPSGIGARELERVLRRRFGTVAGIKRVAPDSDESDV